MPPDLYVSNRSAAINITFQEKVFTSLGHDRGSLLIGSAHVSIVFTDSRVFYDHVIRCVEPFVFGIEGL